MNTTIKAKLNLYRATNIAVVFKETDDILKNRIDKLIELYRADHSDFSTPIFKPELSLIHRRARENQKIM